MELLWLPSSLLLLWKLMPGPVSSPGTACSNILNQLSPQNQYQIP